MKQKSSRLTLVCAFAAGSILLGSVTGSRAQDVVVSTFDDSSFIDNSAFWNWWGGATRTFEFDSTKDANANPASGALKITYEFSGTGDNQVSEGMSLSGSGAYNGGVTVNPVTFTNLEMDLLLDTNSTFDINRYNTSGDPNGLGLGLGASAGWGQTWIPNPDNPVFTNDGAWHHYVIPLNPSWPTIGGLIFKKWFNADTNNVGTITFWVDNIVFKTNGVFTPPIPRMSITKNVKGLQLFAAQPGGQYQRVGIRSVNADPIQWYNNPEPVTYSFTIADFPSPSIASFNFQAHIFLVPDTAGSHGPDYADPNAIMLEIQQTATGGGQATFRYKTNQPNGNSMMYNANPTNGPVGQLARLVSPNILGTWSLTFQNNTNITLTAPDNSSTNFNMPAEDAALFQATTAMGTYFGVQPNNPAVIGQSATFSHIKVTSGATVVEDETFSVVDPGQQVDASRWITETDPSVATSLFVIDSVPSYWVSWTLPDSGWNLVESTNLPPSWYDPALTDTNIVALLDGTTRHALIRHPVPNSSFFALIQRQFTQLQVLLPGETNAPGTLTGKIGTPDPISLGAGGFINVTVHSVDDTFHIVNVSGDAIHLTTTDPSGTTPFTDATLTAGTMQDQVLFGSSGNWTITATDTTNTNIPPATSSSVTVGP